MCYLLKISPYMENNLPKDITTHGMRNYAMSYCAIHYACIKGTSSDRPFQTSLFSKSPDFFFAYLERTSL